MKKEKAQHTPGPWKPKKTSTGSWAIEATREVTGALDAMSGREIAPYTSVVKVASVLMGIEAEANAALIASAPDLLEAAKNALRDIEYYCEGREENHETDTTAKELRAAIAKAEGR